MKKIFCFAALAFWFLALAPASLFAQQFGGIKVDANGVVSRVDNVDVTSLLQRQKDAFQKSFNVSNEIRKYSAFRCVSLNRMEKQIQENQGVVTEDMRYLAGLTRITHVFYFADTQDIVIAGPADGWFTAANTRAANRSFVRPSCELQDLVTALRAFPPGQDGGPLVGCSIDPTEEGSARLQAYLAANRSVPSRGGAEAAYIDGLKQSLGKQIVRVDGIPATTHAANVMVGADYQMKLIGIGVEQWNGLKSFTDLTNITRTTNNNALHRWFFVPDYQAIVVTEDKAAMQLVGKAVKLIGEDEVVLPNGERRVQSGSANKASVGFTEGFTKQYTSIADRAPVFAQLQNFVDMLICAAYIQKEDFYGKAGWKMDFLGDEKKYAVETYHAPTHVEPVVGKKRAPGLLATPIAGGVEVDAESLLEAENVQPDKNGKVAEARAKVKIESNPTNWWWD